MKKKLTLSVDEEVIAQAKEIAARDGTSVSAMFGRIVRARSHRTRKDIEIGPLTRQATGLAKLPPDMTDREILEQALAHKYDLEQ